MAGSNKGGHNIVDPLADLGTEPEIAKAEQESPQSVLSDKAGVPPVEDTGRTQSADELRIAELEAKLAEATARAEAAEQEKAVKAAKGAPKPESELTPEERRIRDLEHQLAIQTSRNLDDAEDVFIPATPGSDTIIMHVLEDGFTANGRVWYRGQEIEFEIGSQAYEDTKDRNGKSWLSIIDDEPRQFERWGKVYVRRGPWPGRKFEDDKALAEERKRNRAAPALPVR